MSGGNAETYGQLAMLLAQYLKKEQPSSVPGATPEMFQSPVSPNVGGSVLGNSGLQGGISPAMVELLRLMQERNTQQF